MRALIVSSHSTFGIWRLLQQQYVLSYVFTDIVVDVGLSIVVAVVDDNYHHAEINSVFHYTQL